jgi:hypothetical protein
VTTNAGERIKLILSSKDQKVDYPFAGTPFLDWTLVGCYLIIPLPAGRIMDVVSSRDQIVPVP